MHDNMGNLMYRPCPIRIYNSVEGKYSFYDFGANQITGWRRKQEDRYVCIPKFHEDLSLFAVYDGHGGERVVQYLERFLHQHIRSELNLHNDPELALYLGFMNCDNSMRTITHHELDIIKEDLNKEFELNESHERRKVIRDFANAGKIGPNPDAGSSSEPCGEPEGIRNEIANTVMTEMASLAFLTKAPLENEDDSDESFEPDDVDIKENMFDESSEDKSESEEPVSSEESAEMEQAEETGGDEVNDKDKEIKQNESNEHLDNKEKAAVPNDSAEPSKKTVEVKSAKRKEKAKIGQHCGSTATVLLLNKRVIYIAHVGDSRCVACVRDQAVELSTDHRPTDTLEKVRIYTAGGFVSQEGRVNSILDMSRAFGDFEMKFTDEDPFQILSCEPSISTIDVTPDLDFIIVASDGIWNTMDSSDVIDYFKRRLNDKMEIRDICAELFEELLPSQISADGSGCDNMTAIVIKFKKCQEIKISTKEMYVYSYPAPSTDCVTTQQDMPSTDSSLSTDPSSVGNCVTTQQDMPSTDAASDGNCVTTQQDMPSTDAASDGNCVTTQQDMPSTDASLSTDASVGNTETVYESIQDIDEAAEEAYSVLEPIPVYSREELLPIPSSDSPSYQLSHSLVDCNKRNQALIEQLCLVFNVLNQRKDAADRTSSPRAYAAFSELFVHLKTTFELEVTKYNDPNYVRQADSFSSIVRSIQHLLESNSCTTQNVSAYVTQNMLHIPQHPYQNTPASSSTISTLTSLHTENQVPYASTSRIKKRHQYVSDPNTIYEVIDLEEEENEVASETEHVNKGEKKATEEILENKVASETDVNGQERAEDEFCVENGVASAADVEMQKTAAEEISVRKENEVASKTDVNGQERAEDECCVENGVPSTADVEMQKTAAEENSVEKENRVPCEIEGEKRKAEESDEVSKKMKTCH